MATVQRTREVQTRETTDLIASDKVEATTVYGSGGKQVGSIKRVMIGKRDGNVAFAVMSFGGASARTTTHFRGRLSRTMSAWEDTRFRC
jgi:PRC-barrel domain